DHIVIACNFTPVPRAAYRIGVPEPCFYREILNSDAEDYGGSNAGNQGGAQADDIAWHGQPCSLEIALPPLAAVYFRPLR
ncbi:MAG TPA: alpha amylase C-terminal domain-containing protein, partial [Thermodesulfovibrionales bacterium]|nr:alpha amylase C-terminal domain-containing protein [Thermodesulfovibrionales bacterium]